YPAAYPACLAVAALDHAGNLTFYSNYGRIDLSAPGGDAVLYQDACTPFPSCCGVEIWSTCFQGGYNAQAGTSFSAPMAPATAGLLLAQDSSRDPGRLSLILTQSCLPAAEGPGYHNTTGWGQLNVYSALTYGTGSPSGNTSLKCYNWPNPFQPTKGEKTN